MQKRFVVLLLALSLVVGLTGVGFAAQPPARIAAISGYFFQGFGLAIAEGLEAAKDKYGIEFRLIDTGTRALDYEEQIANVAQSGDYDLIILMGWELVEAMNKVAQQHPEQLFAFVDGIQPGDNMVSIDFAENEGSFVVGAMAALMTKRTDVPMINSRNRIGFVGGQDIPVIHNFLVGYEQGARYVDPDIDIRVAFAGTFDDPARGMELATALFAQGVDIIYNVAGPTGEGVLKAAVPARAYGIGVDVDQSDVAPGHVMGSMLKRADIATEDIVKMLIDGELKGGMVYHANLAAGAVGLNLDDPALNEILPADVKQRLLEIQEEVVSGKIQIETAL